MLDGAGLHAPKVQLMVSTISRSRTSDAFRVIRQLIRDMSAS
jgi:hypothetical protein